MKRGDLILLNWNIFYYWRNSINDVNTRAGVTFHDLSLLGTMEIDSPSHRAFKDKGLRDDFNFGLRGLRSSGLCQKITSRYLSWCTPSSRRND